MSLKRSLESDAPFDSRGEFIHNIKVVTGKTRKVLSHYATRADALLAAAPLKAKGLNVYVASNLLSEIARARSACRIDGATSWLVRTSRILEEMEPLAQEAWRILSIPTEILASGPSLVSSYAEALGHEPALCFGYDIDYLGDVATFAERQKQFRKRKASVSDQDLEREWNEARQQLAGNDRAKKEKASKARVLIEAELIRRFEKKRRLHFARQNKRTAPERAHV